MRVDALKVVEDYIVISPLYLDSGLCGLSNRTTTSLIASKRGKFAPVPRGSLCFALIALRLSPKVFVCLFPSFGTRAEPAQL